MIFSIIEQPYTAVKKVSSSLLGSSSVFIDHFLSQARVVGDVFWIPGLFLTVDSGHLLRKSSTGQFAVK